MVIDASSGLANDTYALDVKIQWQPVDVTEFTLTLYSNISTEIVNSTGGDAQNNATDFDTSFTNTNARPITVSDNATNDAIIYSPPIVNSGANF